MLASLGVFQFSCLNSEHPFGKIKKVVIIRRSPVSDTKEEFKIRNTDVIKIVDETSDVEFVGRIKRKYGISIVKHTYLGLLVSDKNDTSFVNILIPGGTIVDFNTDRKYGFSKKENQKRLQRLMIPKTMLE